MRIAIVLLFTLAAAYPAVGQDKFANVNGARLFYQDEGTGHPLVLIHGWPMSARMWDDQAAALKEHYRVIRYDRRGFGRSPAEPWNDGPNDHDVADLTALLDFLRVKTAYVLGQSAGGSVAIGMALEHPDRVDALILHGTVPGGMVVPERGPFAVHDSTTLLVKKYGMDSLRKAWAAHPINHTPEDRPDIRARLAVILREYGGADITKGVPQSSSHSEPAIYQIYRIQKPTLVLVGDSDEPFFQIAADILKFEIPGAEKVTIKGGGHIINMIEPERYNGEVMRFLNAVERKKKP
jgi:pimeloyl-ACP methyl ester carboxylesterase